MRIHGFIKSGLLLSSGNAIGALCTFGRNIIITRMISVEDYGIAATFALTMALVQMSTGLGVDRLIVQAVDGNKPRLQATVQAFNILRGLILAIIMYAVASPIAHLFSLPELIWAFQWLAVLPLITGFIHMDIARFQRESRFGALAISESVPQVLAVAVSAPLALYFGDYRVMLWIITLQAISSVVITFMLAERKYRVALDREYIHQIFSFGWPLMLNGILMFGIFQADRGIVGIAYNMEELGWFSAAFTLTMFPAILMMRTAQNLMTPLIAKNQTDDVLLAQSAVASIKAFLILGMLITVGLAIGGPSLSVVLFGEKYLQGAYIIPWLALMHGMRMVKAGPITVAIACGKTKLPLYSNIVRSIAILFALYAVWQGWGVTGIVIGGIVGETLAVIFAVYLMMRFVSVKILPLCGSIVMSVTLIVLALWISSNYITALNPVFEISLAIVFSLAALLISLLFAKDMILWLKNSDQQNKPKLA